MRLRVIGILAALACAWVGPAAAAPEQEEELVHVPDQWGGLRVYLQGRGGITSPVGTFGASLELSFGPHVSLWGGVGHNSLGFQTGAMVHGRLPMGSWWAPAIGLGVSRGLLEADDGNRSAAYFIYPEVSLEFRTRTYGQVRLGAGFGRLLNSSRFADRDFVPLLNLAVGFDLSS